MKNVKLLSPEIVSKIAAGEVVERPASVIKELVENSLDAGATNIDITVTDAGRTLIAVKDNGCGIDPDDTKTIFARHATSKIGLIEDLYSIGTLGFRGEALYSISAVSDCILRTKTQGSDSGWEVHIRGGQRIGEKPCALKNGTEIEVKELFFNTPARRKFMKTDSTEFSQIVSTVTPYAMLSPDSSFSLTHNGKLVLDARRSGSQLSRLADILRIDPENIIEAYKKDEAGGIEVRVFLGDINVQRARKDAQFVFVNNRPVQNRSISFHMNQVYELVFPHNVHPFFAVFINMPPEDLDVNVHPSKREIKMKNEKAVAELIRPLCEHALMSAGHVRKAAKDWLDNEVKVDTSASRRSGSESVSGERAAGQEPVRQYTLFTPAEPAGAGQSQSNKDTYIKTMLSGARFIGSFMNKYLIFEFQQSLLFIDQHAAMERITYEKLLDQISGGKIEVQRLLSPIVLKLNHQEMLAFEEFKDKLDIIGIETTLFDKESIAIHAHPALVKNIELAARNILADGKSNSWDNEDVARRACRSSVMSGDSLPRAVSEHIAKELAECKDPFICPHGRPTVIELDDKFLSKNFLRI